MNAANPSALTESDFAAASCLKSGSIAESARRLVLTSRLLPPGSSSSVLRAWCVPYLFQRMEEALAKHQEPVAVMNEALVSLSTLLGSAAAAQLPLWAGAKGDWLSNASEQAQAVEKVTGEHYGKLFEAFSPESYWEEPTRILRQRLERNGIDCSNFSEKSALDVGCGGGRYTVAWKLLGAKTATGYDISTTGLADARARVESAGVKGVSFEQGNVLELPHPSDHFDIVFSNGVLHHTVDWKKGTHEIVRVLKPGGLGWLYLIENPGGLFWDMIEILRRVMHGESKDFARQALRLLGMPANRIFYMLDHVMVPINDRLTAEEIQSCLESAGAKSVRRLTRGCDFDRVEHIHRGTPYAEIHFGVGEQRFVFSK